MKKLIIAASMLLAGCQAPYGDIVNASEIGKVRIAAEQQQYNGNTKFVSGSGITYIRANNQCGNNCAKYAQREAEYQEEQRNRPVQQRQETVASSDATEVQKICELGYATYIDDLATDAKMYYAMQHQKAFKIRKAELDKALSNQKEMIAQCVAEWRPHQ